MIYLANSLRAECKFSAYPTRTLSIVFSYNIHFTTAVRLINVQSIYISSKIKTPIIVSCNSTQIQCEHIIIYNIIIMKNSFELIRFNIVYARSRLYRSPWNSNNIMRFKRTYVWQHNICSVRNNIVLLGSAEIDQ